MPVDPFQDDHDHHHRRHGDPGPVPELGDRGDGQHQRGGHPAHRVDGDGGPPPLRGRAGVPANPQPVPDHPELRQRERREHADDVQLDQLVQVRVEPDYQDDRQPGQDHDPVREHKPVAQVPELTGDEVVLGQDGQQPREALERRVRRQHQDQRGEHLDQVEPRAAVEHGVGDLGHHGALSADRGVGPGGQERHPQEHGDGHGAHVQQGPLGVASLGPVEDGHGVRDGLHPGQGGGAGRERVEDHEQPERRGHMGQPGQSADVLAATGNGRRFRGQGMHGVGAYAIYEVDLEAPI